MATQNIYAGDGTANQVFNLTFEYLDDSDIRVEIKDTTSDAVATQITKDATNGWELITPTSIRMKGTLQPASTDNVRIYRQTDISSKAVTYAAGSAIRAQDLNKANDQVIFSVEEWRDQRVPLFNAVLPDDVNMGGNQIVNLGAANSDDDAVNREQLGNLIAQDISDDTAQGLQINKSTGGTNSNDLATITIRDSSKSQKGSVTINEGEGIDVTYTNGNAVISGEDSSKSNKGVVSINEGEGVDVTYTNGNAVISGEDSSKTNKGIVSINEAHAIGVTYTAGDAVISADKSTASQQGVIQITPATDSQGNPIQFVRPADGELTLGIPDNSIDLSKLKNVDVVTQAEQNASPDAALTDDDLVTGLAATTRFDTIVSTASQTGTDYPIGKTWLQNDTDKTVSIWDGNAWVSIASGGSFTELTQVIYVDAVNGNDSLAGHRISNPKRTIKAALSDINSQSDGAGTTIILAPGVYQEELPLTVTKENVSIVGSALRSCFIQPKLQGNDANNYNVDNPTASETATMFLCDSGTLLANMTFVGLKASGNSNNTVTRDANGRITTSADRSQSDDPGDSNGEFGLPRNQGWVAAFRSGSNIKKSPYIQNCTNFSDSKFDNSVKYDVNNLPTHALGGDENSACTGGGILCDGDTPSNTSKLRSFVVDSFTQVNLDGPGILVTNNGYAQLVSFFGTFCHYHAKALNGGQINLSNCTSDFGRYGLIADGKSTSARITGAINNGAGYGTGVTTVTVDGLTAATGFFTNQPGTTMVMEIGSDVYQILSATDVSSNQCNVTIYRATAADPTTNIGLKTAVSDNAAVSFKLRSYISTGGHTFEYVGSGTDYRAHPDYGGIADASKQTVELGGVGTSDDVIYNRGKIWWSATDENGQFTVGPNFTVDQRRNLVEIANLDVATNVVNDLTPQLGGNLDLNNKTINGTGTINFTGDVTATNLTGAGANITALNASNLGSGTIPDARFPATLPAASGVNLTNLDASDLASGTVPTARLGTGSSITTKFLRGDNTWQTVNSDLVGDTTPQLGGNLDVQSSEINTSASNGNIKLTPNGTGVVEIKGNGSSNDGTLQLNCSANSHGVKIKSPPHSAAASYTLTLPNDDGDVNQVLKTDGSGVLSWTDQISDVVDDTTPQLGGNLDIQGFDITTTTTNGNIDLTANGTGLIRVTERGLSQVPVVTQHDIGTASNEIPLNQFLGTAAFVDTGHFGVGQIRAWINFDGTSGSIGTGRASGNMDAVTDNGTGDYTVNFTNDMPDANYAAFGASGTNGTTATSSRSFQPNKTSPAVGSFRFSIRLANSASDFDDQLIYVCIVR